MIHSDPLTATHVPSGSTTQSLCREDVQGQDVDVELELHIGVAKHVNWRWLRDQMAGFLWFW
jgi:hypothetical protein